MRNYIKPIQPTPALSGEDAKAIIKEALEAPTNQSIEKNEKRLQESRSVFK